MHLILIAALNNKRVIGKNGKIPWHIPEDIQRFKQHTTGHTVLMGRKTFESIGKQLPGRRNVVITAQPIPGVETYQSIDTALEKLNGEEKIYVIGGGDVFEQTLSRADELVLTELDNDDSGDAFFPDFRSTGHFIQKEKEEHTGFAFVRYERT